MKQLAATIAITLLLGTGVALAQETTTTLCYDHVTDPPTTYVCERNVTDNTIPTIDQTTDNTVVTTPTTTSVEIHDPVTVVAHQPHQPEWDWNAWGKTNGIDW